MTLAPDLSPTDRAAWLECLKQFQPAKPSPYRNNPVEWILDRLGEHLWSKQREIAESVVANRYTAVQSAHGTGKSWISSRLCAWWLTVHPPGDAFVVTTAPTAPQVSAILWREIRKAHKKAGLQGYVTSGSVPEWKLDDGEPIAYGRKPADYDQAAFQGIHARYVLVIVDEACGVPKLLFDAVDSLATNVHARVLAIGNPDDPASHFAKVCNPGSGWRTIRIDGLDTPNMTAEALAEHPELANLFEQEGLQPSTEVVPDALRDLLTSPLWVAERISRWGITSPTFISKVRGEFPDVGEDILIPPSLILAAQQRALDPGPYTILGVDPARYGSDRSTIYVRRGPVLRLVAEYAKQATTVTTGKVIAAQRETGADEIRVDGVGVGGGVVDRLAEQGYPVVDMQAGGAPIERDRFGNARAEWYWNLKDFFEANVIDLDPADEDLAAQLGVLRFRHDSHGRIYIESKDDMRKRGLPSPDRADAAMLTAAPSLPPEQVVEDEDQADAEGSISPY